MNDKNIIPEAEFFEERAAWIRSAFEFIDDDDEGEGWKKADN